MDGRLIAWLVVSGVCWAGLLTAAWMLWKVWKDS